MQLKGSNTHGNLKAAFAGESQANRRYLYFAAKADVEGQTTSPRFFVRRPGRNWPRSRPSRIPRNLRRSCDGSPVRRTRENLKASIAGETHEYTDMYPGMAKVARDEGFSEIADWFETLAKAERSHANRFQKALDALAD